MYVIAYLINIFVCLSLKLPKSSKNCSDFSLRVSAICWLFSICIKPISMTSITRMFNVFIFFTLLTYLQKKKSKLNIH